MSRRVRYSRSSGRRVPFDETKVRRQAGRFADKPGAGDDAPLGPIKTSGITRDDVIESLSDGADRLDGRTIGDVLDGSDDEMAALRALARRHKAGEIRFRDGRGDPDDALETGYLGKRYTVEDEEAYSPPRDADGVLDEVEAEELLAQKVARIRPERVVLTAPIRSARGRADADDMRNELMSSYDSDRNRPSWLSGETREMERQAVEEAVDDYVRQNAKLYTRDYDGDDLMLTLSRPSDSPYWPAREAAEAQFRKAGLSDAQIADEVSGVADRRRTAASLAAAAAARDDEWERINRTLRDAFPNEMREYEALPSSQGRERFIVRSRLLARLQRERGETLAYA